MPRRAPSPTQTDTVLALAQGPASTETGCRASAADIDPASVPSGTGCLDCERDGGWWLHLRRCAACGHIGCCDTSPSRHARAHAHTTGHRVVQSFEPGETWFYDFAAANTFFGPVLAGPRHRPVDAPAPGPADRLPADWRQLLRDLLLIGAHRPTRRRSGYRRAHVAPATARAPEGHLS